MGGQCGEEEGCLHGHGVLLLVGLSRSLVDIDCVRILLCVQVLYPISQVRTRTLLSLQERYESHKSPGFFSENLANCFRRFSGDAHKMLTKFCEHFVSIL